MSEDKASRILIRPERLEDRDAISEVVSEAFAASSHGHHGEADLVDRLRKNCAELISLVAVLNQSVVGHVAFSPVTIETGQTQHGGFGLAPVSVLPSHQRSGVGSRLINTGLDQLLASRCPFVVLIGDPDYYGRFGFQHADQWKLRHEFDGIPQKYLMVKWLESQTNLSISDGTVRYRSEFGP